MSDGETYIADFLTNFRRKHAAEPEFIQSVEELVNSLGQLLDVRPDLRSAGILERITEPERSIQFRVTWVA
ncbi:NADP-specific glutamate dehydrogenase, partial [Candidatus Saccharibacteria bacterium]|nr:NADP-specific glutamate dehydrogenase [Candidatus Saccharibacteria bacterium]